MIEILEFTKHYGDFVAVDRLNLKIPAGEMFGFIGPNGAGKSTTIRFLATLLSATHGEGIVNGLMTVRVGIAAMRVVRPLPYETQRQPKVKDFIPELANVLEQKAN